MDAAVYGVLGTLAGAAIAGVVTIVTNRHQRSIRELEIASEAERKQSERNAEILKTTSERYAAFISCCWQAERYVKEIIDALRCADAKAVDRINGIIASSGYQATIASLNENMGWISILCRTPVTESHALEVSALYDRLMDTIAAEFNLLCRNQKPALAEIDAQFLLLEGELRKLSAGLRDDLSLRT